MREEMASLLERYWGWLKSETTWQPIGEGYEITTPHIDRHNDYTQLYVHPEGKGFRLSDAGYILDDLEMSGFLWDTPRRREILSQTVRGFGVELVENRRLETKAGPDNFPVELHSLLQAMLAVNDMFFLEQDAPAPGSGDKAAAAPDEKPAHKPRKPAGTTPPFHKEVRSWLEDCEIRYKPAVKIPGRSGNRHGFPFRLPASQRQPERLLRPVSQSSNSLAWAVFAGLDTAHTRPTGTLLYALVDAAKGPPAARKDFSDVIRGLKENYDRVIPWSERELVLEELAA